MASGSSSVRQSKTTIIHGFDGTGSKERFERSLSVAWKGSLDIPISSRYKTALLVCDDHGDEAS